MIHAIANQYARYGIAGRTLRPRCDRKPSSRRNQPSSWFQLAKLRLTTITVQRHQQLAVGSDDDRRQESNRPEPKLRIGFSASNVRVGSDLPFDADAHV
jgi:hypothetical protein